MFKFLYNPIFFPFLFTFSLLRVLMLSLVWIGLGPLQADFSTPHLSFIHNDSPITLNGTTHLLRNQASFTHLCHLLHTDVIASLHLLTVQPLSSPSLPTNPFNHHDISMLLKMYNSVFSLPHGLPFHRPHNHHIPLLPQSSPINIKPYRYLHAHKHIMTSLIQEMLQ